jgi:flavodoxin
MKNWKIVLGLLLLAIMVSSCVTQGTPAGRFANSKKLIVYYSLTSNADFVAGHIQALTGADVVKLIPVVPYSVEFEAAAERVNREREAGILPELTNRIDNLADYDVIFLGTPNWFGTISNPLSSFLASHDLSGKTIVPFITFGRGGLMNTITDLKAALPNSTILEEFGVSRDDVRNSQSDISQWLGRIGMLR